MARTSSPRGSLLTGCSAMRCATGWCRTSARRGSTTSFPKLRSAHIYILGCCSTRQAPQPTSRSNGTGVVVALPLARSLAGGKLFFEDLASTIHYSQTLSVTEASTSYGQVISKMRTANAESAERKRYLELGLRNALGRIDCMPNLNEAVLLQLAQAVRRDSFFEGQHIFTQGEEDDEFYIVRRGKVELLIDGEVIRSDVGPGQGIGEIGLLFSTRRNLTARCCGPVEMFVLDRASYQTSLSTLPLEDRAGQLESILHKFWLLVSRAGPNHVPTATLGFQIYRKLNIRTGRSLMMAEDADEIDEDEERKQSGADWTEDW